MPRPNQKRTIGKEAVLAQRIAYERERRGWSYEAVAEAMTNRGCPIQGSAIYKILHGDPPRRVTVDEIVALSEVFEVGLDDLLTPAGSEVMPRGFVDDLDDVCILSDLNARAAQALADHDEAGSVVDALINAGFIRRTDLEYRNGSAVRI